MPSSPPSANWTSEAYKTLYAIAQKRRRRDRIRILQQCDENTLMCIVELICNILADKIPIDSRQTRIRLYRQRGALRQASRLRDTDKVRQFLVQKEEVLWPSFYLYSPQLPP